MWKYTITFGAILIPAGIWADANHVPAGDALVMAFIFLIAGAVYGFGLGKYKSR
jgi:hypothetical protein